MLLAEGAQDAMLYFHVSSRVILQCNYFTFTNIEFCYPYRREANLNYASQR